MKYIEISKVIDLNVKCLIRREKVRIKDATLANDVLGEDINKPLIFKVSSPAPVEVLILQSSNNYSEIPYYFYLYLLLQNNAEVIILDTILKPEHKYCRPPLDRVTIYNSNTIIDFNIVLPILERFAYLKVTDELMLTMTDEQKNSIIEIDIEVPKPINILKDAVGTKTPHDRFMEKLSDLTIDLDETDLNAIIGFLTSFLYSNEREVTK